MNFDQVKLLREEFKKRHGRELAGTKLGQLHSDFDIDSFPKGSKADNVFSTSFYPMAKKLYLHELATDTEEGKRLTGVQHKRKGIS